VRDRPAEWPTIETATMSDDAQLDLFRNAASGTCMLVDALGTWLAAKIAARIDLLEVDYSVLEAQLDEKAAAFVDAMLDSSAYVVAVSEQIGWDVVPVAAAARLFRDAMGRMAQRLAKRADKVYLVVAGYALDLRALGEPIDAV
jgi:adenosylcobinamide kinase/adenosylcobinamide-phosphate guanylyltransferase